MKKINYFYLICTTFMFWAVVDGPLCIFSYCPGWLVLVLLLFYVVLYLMGMPFIYVINKRRGVKNGFITSYRMEAQWTTLWIDCAGKELAYLCMFNPFTIHYLPLHFIDNAKVEVYYSKDKAYIDHVNCSFCIHNKQNRIRVVTRGRYDLIEAETRGKELINMSQQFVDILNRDW